MKEELKRNHGILWKPSADWKNASNISAYMHWLEDEKKLSFHNYADLWEWSTTELEDFWESVWQYFHIDSSGNYRKVLSSRKMPGARWFEGTVLNYAEHVFKNSEPAHTAIIFRGEGGKDRKLSYSQLKEQIGAVATWLKETGLRRGDRVAAYLPNIPEAVVAFLACASIGAVWSSCSPDFGGSSVINRFAQIKPKALFFVRSYEYNGKRYDKSKDVKAILAAIPSIEKAIAIPTEGESKDERPSGKMFAWEEVVARRGEPRFSRVPFSHPLWILYSSGTTGPPKAIVQGHGGILLEHYKVLSFHNDLKPASRFFWFTSTGWMMWNYLVGGLLLGSTVMLYDGSPAYPSMSALWNFCEEERMTYFGTSAAYISSCMKAGIRPRDDFPLRELRGIGSTGSPLSPEGFNWVYENVKDDLWLASMSGGTDLCTSFVAGCPILPVRSGRIQCRCLGAKVESFDQNGKAMYDETGELVLTAPMPSMPVSFWNDRKDRRYIESYFSIYPGVWRHGDWIRVNSDGSCVIYGRSDATIKRMGVRIGSSEIYKVVESIPEILDSLVVSLEYLGEKSYMPIFVVLRRGSSLDAALEAKIREKLRIHLSPRFVPDEVFAVPEIPKTLNGKKSEVPIRKILLGAPVESALNRDSLKNPGAIQFFVDLSARLSDRLRGGR